METVIQKKRSSTTGIVQMDARGSHEPINKISEDNINFVKHFFNTLPTYESLYAKRLPKKISTISHYTC